MTARHLARAPTLLSRYSTFVTPVATALLGAVVVGCAGPPAPMTPEAEAANLGASTSQEPDTSANPPAPEAKNAGEPIQSPLLDDLEDGDGQITFADARGGYWYTYKDDGSVIEPQGSFKPVEGGANGSKFAARMQGTIGSEIQYPFAGMGFLFVDPKGAYDVSGCDGIKFFAKKGEEGETVKMRFKLGDVNTVPEGGVCKECYNDFGRDILLTDEWTEFTARFSEMKQEPYWGESRPALVPTLVYQVQFQVVAQGPFDVWVDDISLTGCTAQPE